MSADLNPIYDRHFLHAARVALRESPPASLAEAKAALDRLAGEHKQPKLPYGVVADLLELRQHRRMREPLRLVTPPLVLVNVASNDGRLARLQMEWLEGESCSGCLYASAFYSEKKQRDASTLAPVRRLSMADLRTDGAWAGAVNAAQQLAESRGYAIPPNADVRWWVELVDEADARARGEIFDADIEPWKSGESLEGRSAGAAFLIGLVYLCRRAHEGVAIEAEVRREVVTLLPLLVLPELPQANAPVEALGGAEHTKLAALRLHLHNLTLIFPDTHGEGVPERSERAANVAELVGLVVKRMQSGAIPNTIKAALGAGQHYVGRENVDALVASLRRPGPVVVHGPAGIGKTARVLEAARRLIENENAFDGGRLFINLYEAAKAGGSLELAVLKGIVVGFDKTSPEDFKQLKARAQALLAGRRVLVILEGAENVPEAEIAEVLTPFGGNTHVAWLTRRATDAREPGLDGCPAHEVLQLSPEESRELLCHHAELKEAALNAASLAALDTIAKDAEHTPQLLVWAGRALAHDGVATPAQIAAEIHADPLAEIADPTQRREENARRFLERSLTRIRPTAEHPALDATARRLFAALTAFHPAHGAPARLWALAAGLDLAEREPRREFAAARRALLSLRLARLEGESAHPVHALAGTLAAALWHEQPAEMRETVLASLAHAALRHLAAPRPDDWPRNLAWLADTTALARHWEQWTTSAGLDSATEIARAVARAWTQFFDQTLRTQPCLALRASVASACRSHFESLARAHSNVPNYQLDLAISWDQIGDVERARQDWTAAEQAYAKQKKIAEALTRAYPDALNYQRCLCVCWIKLGDVRLGWQDLTGAEQAYAEQKKIAEALAQAHPDLPHCQHDLSLYWERIGDVRSARQDWTAAEQAYAEAKKIAEALARAHPDVPNYQQGLATSWDRVGDVRRARQDWTAAEQAYAERKRIAEALARAYPDVPEYQDDLSMSWDAIGIVRGARHDWTGAEQAYAEAKKIGEALALAYPDVPDYQQGLATSWIRVGDVRHARQDWIAAEQAYAEAKKIAEALARAHPDVPDYQQRLATCWNKVGTMRRARQDWSGAEQAYAEQKKIDETLARAHPDVPHYQRNLSISWEGLGDVGRNRQDWTAAEQAYAEAKKIGEALALAHPDVPDYQRNLCVSWNKVGAVREARHDWTGAEQAYAEARKIAEALARAHPDLPDYQCDLAVSWGLMAEIAEHGDDWPEALKGWRRACETMERLVAAIPGVPDFEDLLLWHELRLAMATVRAGQTELARAACDAGLACGVKLHAQLEAAGIALSERQQQILAELSALRQQLGEAE